MKRIITIGRPTHLKIVLKRNGIADTVETACGLLGEVASNAAHDPRDVDCLRCRRTRKYLKRLKGETHDQ